MAYYAPVDPLTGLPYATDVGYTGVTGVGVVDPLTGGYVVGGGLGLGGAGLVGGAGYGTTTTTVVGGPAVGVVGGPVGLGGAGYGTGLGAVSGYNQGLGISGYGTGVGYSGYTTGVVPPVVLH